MLYITCIFNNYSPKAKIILLNNPRDEVEGIIQQCGHNSFNSIQFMREHYSQCGHKYLQDKNQSLTLFFRPSCLI